MRIHILHASNIFVKLNWKIFFVEDRICSEEDTFKGVVAINLDKFVQATASLLQMFGRC